MIRIVVVAALGIASYFFGPFGIGEEVNVDRERMIQNAVFGVLEQAHFDPLDLNDEISEEVYKEFLEAIDGRKRFFTKEDLIQLEPYKTQLDDQAQVGSLEFFDLATSLLEARIEAAEQIFTDLLNTPFTFEDNEFFEFDPDKKDYAANEEELVDLWRKSLKYDVMAKIEGRLEDQEDNDDKELKSFEQIEEESREAVKENYDDWYKNFKKVRRSDRFEAYLNSFSHLFDPHTDYYNPKEKQDFDINMGGKLEGIGARLRSEDDLTKVVSIVPGGPAWKGKQLEVDDAILKVAQKDEEPVDVFGMRIDDVVSMIRGDKGTIVILTIQKADGTILDIEIEREIVEIEETYARSAVMDLDGAVDNIGYIHLPKFYSSFEGPDGTSCAADIAKEIKKLKDQNVNGIILDLRNNGGGSLRDVVDMSGLFIEEGPIVQVKPRDRKAYVYKDEDDSVLYDGPLVVMINSFSASASEILAAALQDYNRAVIVGSQSFGKGTVQRFIDLDRAVRGNSEHKPLGQLKLTMQKFYRVNGGSTQRNGVTPDIELPDRFSYIEIGEREYPHSLEWSQIAGLDYSQEVYQVKDIKGLSNRSAARIKANDQFTLISEQAKLLKDNRDKTSYSLNFEEFDAYLEAKDAESEKFEGLYKQELESLLVSNLEVDLEAINFDESTKARNEDWIKGLKKDIYLEETLAIIGDMIKGPAYTNNVVKEKEE